MDEFDIYLESAGSTETYQQNTMTCLRNLLTEPLQLEGDWRVALAEIFSPKSIKNVSTIDYFVYTPKIPFNISTSTGNTSSGSEMVEHED